MTILSKRIVLWSRRWRTLRSNVRLRHTAINNQLLAVDKAGIIACQKHHHMRLLNCLSKPAGGEVDLPAEPLGLIVTQPVLQQWSVQRSGAEVVEAVAFARVDDRQFAGHGEHRTLGGGVGKLGSSGADQGNDGRGVNHRCLGLVVAAEGEDGMFAAEPNALHVDVVGQVPDSFGGVDGVVVLGTMLEQSGPYN